MKIPKIIHFIWAGGDYTMPIKNAQVVQSWHLANPTFDIYLWIDEKSVSSPTIIETNRERYRNLFGNLEGKLHFKDIENTSNNNGQDVRMANDHIRYEIDRIRPNYGASSDLLRYRILSEFGGAYFDSDVMPGGLSLENSLLFDSELSQHHLYVDSNSQNTGIVGNDSLICTPENPLMHQIFTTAMQHYHLQAGDLDPNHELFRSNLILAEMNSQPNITYQYDNLSYILLSTPFKTGPFCIRKNVEAEVGELKEMADDNLSVISSMRDLTSSISNDRHWVGKKLPVLDHDIAVRKTRSSLEFEAKEFDFIRLDDHVNNLSESTRCSDAFAEETIINLVKSINIKESTSIQLSYEHDATIGFCEDKKLLGQTYLFPLVKSCYEKTKDVSYFKPAVCSVMAVEEYAKLSDYLSVESNATFEAMEAISKRRLSINKFLSGSLDWCESLMEKLSDNVRGTSGQESMVANYLECLSDNVMRIKGELNTIGELIQNKPAIIESDRSSQIAEIMTFSQELKERECLINNFYSDHKLEMPSKLPPNAMVQTKKADEEKNVKIQGNNKDDDADNKCGCRIS